jgi:hypothetical protein
LSVDGWNAGYVDDGDLGASIDETLQQILHCDLGAFAVERADKGKRAPLNSQCG